MSEMSQHIEELCAAVCEMQKAELFALKDSANPFYKSRYADLSSCWAAARGPLTANGLGVIQTTEIGEAGIPVIVTTLVHKSGQWIRGRLSMAPAKADPQGVGSAITYARRYALAAILGLCPEDDDAEKAMDRKPPKKHEAKPTPPSSAPPAPPQEPTEAITHYQPTDMSPDERRQVAASCEAVGVKGATVRQFVAWIAEQKGCSLHDRKILTALETPDDAARWLDDWETARGNK